MTDLLPVALAVVAVLAASAAFAIAYRRSKDPAWKANVEAKAVEADKPSEVPVLIAASGSPSVESAPETVDTSVDVDADGDAHDEVVIEYVEASPEEQGVTRRMFLNRALLAMWGTFLAGFGMASLSFLWPKVKGGFGSDIDAGDADEILDKVLNPDGTVVPLFLPEARGYIVPILDESVNGSQFEDNATVTNSLVALFQTCVHLGCRVPWCGPSQGFECPCHGSKYNSIGEYIAGPAPRNLDRFIVVVDEKTNRLIIKTGSIIKTARAPRKSVKYPQGPSCI